MENDAIAIFIALNSFLYIIIHIIFDLRLILNPQRESRQQKAVYSPWNEKNPQMKYFLLLATFYFWFFFIFWPFFHFFDLDAPFLAFSAKIPIIGDSLQIIGGIIVAFATFIAIYGRIARGQQAISWGVPVSLTTHGGFGLVRHPLYASYCCYFTGMLLMLQNILLLPLLLGVYGYYDAAKYEEEILLAEFGEAYRQYQQRVGMMVPFVGKRKKS
ncbi:MAG: methyltransferase family protein [Candidatus Hodarchaeota archaeon]